MLKNNQLWLRYYDNKGEEHVIVYELFDGELTEEISVDINTGLTSISLKFVQAVDITEAKGVDVKYEDTEKELKDCGGCFRHSNRNKFITSIRGRIKDYLNF